MDNQRDIIRSTSSSTGQPPHNRSTGQPPHNRSSVSSRGAASGEALGRAASRRAASTSKASGRAASTSKVSRRAPSLGRIPLLQVPRFTWKNTASSSTQFTWKNTASSSAHRKVQATARRTRRFLRSLREFAKSTVARHRHLRHRHQQGLLQVPARHRHLTPSPGIVKRIASQGSRQGMPRKDRFARIASRNASQGSRQGTPHKDRFARIASQGSLHIRLEDPPQEK